jgi:serine/threonine protein kinase
MNEPHVPNVTTDLSSPADPLRTTDPLGTTDHAQGSASTDGSHPGADAPMSNLPAVPGYHVVREIARGGMGRVLAAHDLSLDRDVALKILLPGANCDRFVRESKITPRLPHPGIPPVHALGTLADGSPFLAMKLIAGQTLADEMKHADRPRLLQAFVQVCQAVGFAHSRGIIHRDLKPANVMVGAFGEVQVMDWGLAKDLTSQEAREEPRPSESSPTPVVGAGPGATTGHHAAGESTDDQTQAGMVMGTPAYMAPEQARGEATDVRADVFALGGILCAILTG